MKEIKVNVGSVVKFRHDFLKGKSSLVVFKKQPSLCNNCFEKMNIQEADVAVSPTKDPKKISVLLINVGFLWNSVDKLKFLYDWNPKICNKWKAIFCDACQKKPADWLFDHLNENFLPAFKEKKIDAGVYFFVNYSTGYHPYTILTNMATNIIDYFKIDYKDIIDHKIWIINGNHVKKIIGDYYKMKI